MYDVILKKCMLKIADRDIFKMQLSSIFLVKSL